MKKLQLIKPWRLQAFRQTLGAEGLVLTEASDLAVPCRGPEANHLVFFPDECRFGTGQFEAGFMSMAPFSDVIFAPANCPNP